MSKPRPDFIKHWSEIQDPDNSAYKGSTELLSIGSPFGKRLGITGFGFHHEVLPPGRRTSRPHAEEGEDEFIFVIEGTPDAWVNGELYRLQPGDGVAFPKGTGIAHTFINNTESDVRLIVVGERTPGAKIHYPLNPEMKAERADWWHECPPQTLGSHDGLPDKLRK